ncbi:MAG TPA: NAD(P)H-dependent glycerol-3-phosphate dehydrogenase [Blastocatellia bacterium]|jgi:glycerol-3-phosphate dehydrogenase (NAD(P)+)|nr:NAD(P)H-dependent glycerol-3-phosphate dehydrogenase [Blastocatellia bacterium]
MVDEAALPESKRIAVIGAGSWGTALAIVAARNNHDVRLWAREPEVATGVNRAHRNPFYLSSFDLPENIRATTSFEEALAGADFVLVVVPSHAMREVVERMRKHVGAETVLVSATKGVENGTLMRMDEVMTDVLGEGFAQRFVVLSGPSFALEVAGGDPTAIVAASREAQLCERVQRELSSNVFRVYTNDDCIGVELGGAIKNVVAIASGVVRGLGLGTNAVAAIITRGLAEMTRLALAQGARAETMAGLAGLGDLVLTCTGELSRNRHVGVELGRGRKLADIVGEMREVAEGVKTTRAIYELGLRLEIDMPITASIHALLYEDKPALEAANELMGRPLKKE